MNNGGPPPPSPTPLDPDAALRWLRDQTGEDATVHTVSGYDGDNNFCVHPTSREDEEFRGVTLEEALRGAIAHVARTA